MILPGKSNNDAIQIKPIQYPEINVSGLLLDTDLIENISAAISGNESFALIDTENQSFTICVNGEYTIAPDDTRICLIRHADRQQLFNTIKLSLIGNRTFIPSSRFIDYPFICDMIDMLREKHPELLTYS